MNFMLEALESIVDFFSSIIDFIIGFINNVVETVKLVTEGYVLAGMTIAFLPVAFQAVITTLLAYYLIKAILSFGG